MTIKSSADCQSGISKDSLKVAVLMGGISRERDISIQSGSCIAHALEKAGVNVVTADIQPDALDVLEDRSIDVFFPALHGEFGEDGRLQQILEDKSLLYTGSGPTASKLAFDKMASKKAFTRAGIPTPQVIEFNSGTDLSQLEKSLRKFADKYVIKPLRQGSSIGVTIVADWRKVIPVAQETFSQFGDCMIEKFVPGRDVTVGILCDQPLPIIEIRTKTDFYDYHAKYLDEQTEFLFDTIEDPVLEKKIKATALDCFRVLGCRHFARVDFILGQDGVPHALEVNTIPGFTDHSLLPKAAAKAGISMSDLCVKIIEAALAGKNNKKASFNQATTSQR